MLFGYSGIIQFVFAAIAIVISIVLHELAHGYVALWNGDHTAKAYGRLSLNPLVHFDPIGLLMLALAHFGYARPVPVNPDNFKKRRRGCFTVSIAGIVLNLVLSFICVPFYFLCVASSIAFFNVLSSFFYWMIIINANLAVFNILPIYPLDGFRIVESFTRSYNPFVRFMHVYGQYVLIALIGVSVLVSNFGFPFWLDILGMYIDTLRGWLLDAFTAFWRLII